MKSKVISLLILLMTPVLSWAQCTLCACFTVDNNRGCAPLTVNITSCYPGAASGAKYNYDFANQPTGALVFTTTHTYNTPGKYVIMQLVNDPPGTNFITDTIEVLGKPAPLFSTTLCAANRVQLVITDTNYDNFDVDFGDGTTITMAPGGLNTHSYPNTNPRTISVTGRYTSGLCTGAWTSATRTITPFTTLVAPDVIDLTVNNQAAAGSVNLRYNGILDRLYKIEFKVDAVSSPALTDTITAGLTGTNTQTITALNTQTKTYTLRLQNIDMCASIPASSVEISSIIVTPSALNGSNQVNFVSNGGLLFSSYALYRNTILINNNATSPFSDNSVLCGTDYCYQIQGTLPMSPSGTIPKSFSATACVKATYTGTAPVLTNINSTVEDNHIKLVWDTPVLNAVVPSVDFYTVYRENNGSFNNYGSSNSNSYLDNAANASNQPYCYKVSYRDACNNVSAISINTCTIHLTVNRTDEINYLSWTPYTGYLTGIKEYLVENLDESGNVLLSKSVGTTTSFSETADPTLAQIIYRIKAVPNGTENLISVSNVVRIDLTPQVYMPTIFTPNGDGENDVLEVKGKYYKSVKMTIVNKWGEVIFISEDAGKGWDGNYKGQPVSVDSYAYHIVAFDNKGQEITLKGVVSLLR